MPEYWFSIRAIPQVEDEEQRKLCEKIVAPYKPYFMIYVYPALKRKLFKYIKNNERKTRIQFRKYQIKSIKDVSSYENKTQEMDDFLMHYNQRVNIGVNPCVVNRICWIFEEEFSQNTYPKNNTQEFDYTILKCGVEYSKSDFNKILELYKKYKNERDAFVQKAEFQRLRDDSNEYSEIDFINKFRRGAYEICNNEQELCDIVLDICYRTENSKQFAWDITGNVIISNLLRRHNNVISYPKHGGSDFTYCGEGFSMERIKIGGDI